MPIYLKIIIAACSLLIALCVWSMVVESSKKEEKKEHRRQRERVGRMRYDDEDW